MGSVPPSTDNRATVRSHHDWTLRSTLTIDSRHQTALSTLNNEIKRATNTYLEYESMDGMEPVNVVARTTTRTIHTFFFFDLPNRRTVNLFHNLPKISLVKSRSSQTLRDESSRYVVEGFLRVWKERWKATDLGDEDFSNSDVDGRFLLVL